MSGVDGILQYCMECGDFPPFGTARWCLNPFTCQCLRRRAQCISLENRLVDASYDGILLVIHHVARPLGISPHVAIGRLLARDRFATLDARLHSALCSLPDFEPFYFCHESSNTLKEASFSGVREFFSNQGKADTQMVPFTQEKTEMGLATTHPIQSIGKHHIAVFPSHRLT